MEHCVKHSKGIYDIQTPSHYKMDWKTSESCNTSLLWAIKNYVII